MKQLLHFVITSNSLRRNISLFEFNILMSKSGLTLLLLHIIIIKHYHLTPNTANKQQQFYTEMLLFIIQIK